MRAPPDQKEKVEPSGNSIRPDDSTPDEEAQTAASMAQRGESVKRADPWLTLGLLRDDLKVIVALLSEPDAGNGHLALRRALRALHRVGDGEISAEGWR